MLAVRRVSHGQVIRILGPAKCGHVTTDALRGESLAVELPDRSHFVAGVTIDGGVGADQRKTVLMFVDVVNGNLPSGIAMAHVALGAVLAAMDVSVTILALAAHVGKNPVQVAAGAGHLAVQASQRKPGLAVIKLGNSTDRFPGLGTMTILTRYVERTMRTARGS